MDIKFNSSKITLSQEEIALILNDYSKLDYKLAQNNDNKPASAEYPALERFYSVLKMHYNKYE